MVEKFGVDGTRYLLAGWPSFSEDIDITWQNMIDKYNADLANGLGNLVSRVFNIIEKNFDGQITAQKIEINIADEIEGLRLSEALEKIKEKIDWANKYIDEVKLWDLVKTDKEKSGKVLSELLGAIIAVGESLQSFMPKISKEIIDRAGANKIEKGEGLFARIK